MLFPPGAAPAREGASGAAPGKGEPAEDGDAGSGGGHPIGWTGGSVKRGGFLGAGGGGREGAGGISPSFRAVPFQVFCRKGVPAAAAPPPPRCPTALPWECVTAIFRQDPVPPAVKLLPGALAFIFHRFLENVFFPLSLSVRSWPSPWIFEGRFLTSSFFRVLFQPLFISPVSDLKSKQKNPLKP